MTPYLVDVGPILDTVGESVVADAPFALDDFAVGDQTFTIRTPATVDALVTNTGAGIVATGRVVAHVTAVCSRCLRDFPLDIGSDIEGFYVRPGDDVDLPEEQDVEFVSDDDTIDLAPALRAAIVLEAPFAPLHDDACAGICTQCGADLNEAACACVPEEDTDHPFAKLRELLEDAGESSDQD